MKHKGDLKFMLDFIGNYYSTMAVTIE